MVTTAQTEPGPAALEAARALQERRFAACDRSHPAVRALFEDGTVRLARAMECDPKPFAVPAAAPGQKTVSLSAPSRFIHEIVPPPLPGVFIELQHILADDIATDADIAKVVSTDPGLTGFLLRMVNSAFYGFSSRIDTVTRAVAMLGRREILAQASAQAVSAIYKDLPPRRLLDMKRFWRHSLACGLLCRAAALALRAGDPEQLFVAGLLHDIGRPQLLLGVPDAAEAAINAARREGVHICQAETRLFGYDHGDVAAMVFQKWNFAEELILAVGHHHHPERGRGSLKAALVHVADFIADAACMTVEPGAPVPPFSAEAWERSGLTATQAVELVVFVEDNLDVFAAMFPTA